MKGCRIGVRPVAIWVICSRSAEMVFTLPKLWSSKTSELHGSVELDRVRLVDEVGAEVRDVEEAALGVVPGAGARMARRMAMIQK